jgi:TonB-dependent receptor
VFLEDSQNLTNECRPAMIGHAIRLIAFAASLLLIALPGFSYAQEQELEEVVVTGIRASMQNSIAAKRNSDTIVDTISLEDLGKLPDENIAEALQRVPGVAIDRNKGEGRFVTIRGLGPDLVKVTINGRTAPGDSDVNIFSDTVAKGGRAFSFDQLQSEMISALEVYKSPFAALTEGGIGGTINVQTPRPLELNKRVVSLAATAVYDELPDETSPKFSALYSNVFANGNMGITVAAAYSERAVRLDKFDITGHFQRSFACCAITDAFIHANIRTFLSEEDRERTNLNATYQWQMNDDWLFTFDALYTNFDITEDTLGIPTRSQQGIANAFDVQLDSTTNTVNFYDTTGPRPRLDAQSRDITRETVLLGANFEYAGDRWNADFDFAWSENETDNQRIRVNHDALVGVPFTSDLRNSRIPEIAIGIDFNDTGLFGLNQLRDEPVFATDEEFQFRFNGDYDLGDGFFRQLAFGTEYRDRNKFRDRDRLVVSSANFGGPGANLLSLLPTTSFPSDFLSDQSVLSPLSSATFADVHAAFDVYLNQRRDEIPQSVFDSAEFPQGDFEVDEETLAFYLQGNFEGSLGDTPVRGNVGVRAVQTEQSSFGFQSPILDVDIASGNVIFGAPTGVTVDQDYWDILPSLNVVFDVGEDFLFRFAAGKTITRPILEEMSPGTISANGSLPSVTNGNPNLDPFEAINVDLSAEWYFDEDAILSVALFWKDIDSFIFNQTRIESVILPDGSVAIDPFTGNPIELNVVSPQNGPGGEISGVELAFVDQFDWLPYPFDGFGAQFNYTYVDTTASFVNEALGLSFGVPGLSESTLNLAVFYEKGPGSIRLAYNQRDEFLELVAGLQTNPEFVEEYATVDLSVSYHVNDSVTLTLEGINLNDEKLSKYSAIPQRVRLLDETGRRYFFGVRATF